MQESPLQSTTENAANHRFWENVHTSSWPNQRAELHVIVPTMLITYVHDYNHEENPERTLLEHVSSIQHTLCCQCGESVAEQRCFVGFRFLFSKSKTADDKVVAYHSAFVSTVYCEECAVTTEVKMKCDYPMINAILDEFEAVALILNEQLYMVDMPVQMFMNCVLNRMRVLHVELLETMGTFIHHCMHCKTKRRAAFKCDGCRINTYCNKKCWKRDWKMHKRECLWLQTMSMFTTHQHHMLVLAREEEKKEEEENVNKQNKF